MTLRLDLDRMAAPAAVAEAPLTPPHAARERLAQWLLGDEPQLALGRHAGAVVGWVDARGRADYAYPEITGYYLRWLAWQAACGRDSSALAPRAEAAQRWLRSWIESAPLPRTRVYLHGPRADWRNHALFCFDLAMALRGVGSAAARGLVEPDPVVVERFCGALERLVGDDGLFDAYAALDAGYPMPDRWSTRRGAFLAKPAAGILIAARELPGVPESLVRCALRTFGAALDWMVQEPHDEVHAQMYAIEGLLGCPEHPRFAATLAAIDIAFCKLLERCAALGRVPEMKSADGCPRNDVVAQVLRIAALLHGHGFTRGAEHQIVRSLSRRLTESLSPAGAIAFDSSAGPLQYNTWTAMFTEQALALRQPGAVRERTSLASLLV